MAYACPVCKTKLESKESAYFCSKCPKEYPVVDNIPVFCNQETYYGESDQDNMKALITNARTHGYEFAIAKVIKDPFVLAYVLDEKRALWANLLPLTDDTLFLDVGCGWGNRMAGRYR